MHLTRFQQITLGLSGVTALAIGSFILCAPRAFYESYGIALASDPNLLSELRAPGAGLAGMGAIMLSGLIRPAMATAAWTVALCVYLTYPLGRLMSLIWDGIPSGSILVALAIEILIACALVIAFARGPKSRSNRTAPLHSH